MQNLPHGKAFHPEVTEVLTGDTEKTERYSLWTLGAFLRVPGRKLLCLCTNPVDGTVILQSPRLLSKWGINEKFLLLLKLEPNSSLDLRHA